MFIYKYMHIIFQCLNMKTNTSSWTVSKADTHFQYSTSDSLKIYLQGNFTISVNELKQLCTSRPHPDCLKPI